MALERPDNEKNRPRNMARRQFLAAGALGLGLAGLASQLRPDDEKWEGLKEGAAVIIDKEFYFGPAFGQTPMHNKYFVHLEVDGKVAKLEVKNTVYESYKKNDTVRVVYVESADGKSIKVKGILK